MFIIISMANYKILFNISKFDEVMSYKVQPPNEFSLFTVPTSSQRMNGHQIHKTSTHFTIIVGCNASGISQTSLKAQDHSGAITRSSSWDSQPSVAIFRT